MVVHSLNEHVLKVGLMLPCVSYGLLT